MAEATSQPMTGFFAVPVKTDCPHFKNALNTNVHPNTQEKCENCENIGENWVCLTCCKVYCSRYVRSHMVQHNTGSRHPVALSFSDASVWCYTCDSYIDDPVLRPICDSVANQSSTFVVGIQP
ncbi:NAD-dependent deacetylase sir2A-like [Clytia hemisphaerica]|uniref:NAD-dependent deacetylase sir2A-like n=1 Tax=Clytia hemisphaerica TaxID=252671 RepID=UPI0034D66C39